MEEERKMGGGGGVRGGPQIVVAKGTYLKHGRACMDCVIYGNVYVNMVMYMQGKSGYAKYEYHVWIMGEMDVRWEIR